jgi:hypothetical protein
MIRTKTAFILGAGASKPYGFPTGRELVASILSGLEPQQTMFNLLTTRECGGFSERHLSQFRTELRNSRRSSVDAFLEKRSDFVEVGKASIAVSLMPLEHDHNLLGAPSHEDWYAYLFDRMLKGNFTENRLSVITFNFDRSFERALFNALKASYGHDDVETSTLCHCVPIIHFHGDLGEPLWLVDSIGPRPRSREYGCEQHFPDREAVKWCADRIRLGSEGPAQDTMEDAHQLLDEAKRVCFIGFGFDPLALERLDVTELTRGKIVRGTRLGMTETECAPAFAAFEKIHLTDWDAVTFLRQTDVIHE